MAVPCRPGRGKSPLEAVTGDGRFDYVPPPTTRYYPKIQIRDGGDVQLATMVPQYGTLSFTLEGPKAFGVGRAEMFGREVAESTRAEVVTMRRVEER